MSGELTIVSSYLADNVALAEAFEAGQTEGVEGFQAIGLLEAGMEEIGGEESSLPALLTAYKQALTFGNRGKALALGQAIARELRADHKLLEKIRARMKLKQPTLFAPTPPVSFYVTESRRSTRNHSFAQMGVGSGEIADRRGSTGIKATGSTVRTVGPSNPLRGFELRGLDTSSSKNIGQVIINYLRDVVALTKQKKRPPVSKKDLTDLLACIDHSPQDAPAYLERCPELAKTLADMILKEGTEFSNVKANWDFKRLQNFVKIHGKLVLPGIYFDPENRMKVDPFTRLAELEDMELARMALFYQINRSHLKPAEQKIARALQPGGILYERLLDAIERQVVAWPKQYEIKDFSEQVWRAFRAGQPLPRTIRLNRFDSTNFLWKILREGYDPWRYGALEQYGRGNGDWYDERFPGRLPSIEPEEGERGAYFFEKLTRGSYSQIFVIGGHGVPNIRDGIFASIEHQIPFFAFLTFLAAADDKAYSASIEFSIYKEGTQLFREMIEKAPGVETKIVLYSYPNTPAARFMLKAMLEAGGRVYFNLGKDEEAFRLMKEEDVFSTLEGIEFDPKHTRQERVRLALGVINSKEPMPRGHVGSDNENEELFFLKLLFFSQEDAEILFQAMAAKNPLMAERALEFYASTPGFSLPRLKIWQQVWSRKSRQLNRFLTKTTEQAEHIARRFMGRTLKPGDKF